MSEGTALSELAERDARHNILALGVDYVTFGTGMAFLGPTTILPALIRLLGGSPVVVGSLGTIQSGSWLLPQLFAGRYVANRPFVKKLVVAPAVISRSLLWLLVPVLWYTAPRAPSIAIAAILLAYAGFGIFDSLGSVGWFELVVKGLPAARRGRLLGVMQSLSSLMAIGAGAVVGVVLARPGPAWSNHLLLVLVAAAFFCIGPGFIASIREPRGAVQGSPHAGWAHYLPRLASIVRSDRRFVWLLAVRMASGLADMATAFYILFAVERLHVPEEMIGLFVSAGVAGGLLSGALLGPLGDRKGSAQVVVVIMVLRCLAPSLALAAPLVAAGVPQLALGALVLVFVASGMANSAYMVGFTNYLMEIAPPGEGATYIALSNTLCGLLTVAPLFAGWLVQVASYELVFGLTLGVAALGLAVALRRPMPVAVPARAAQ